MSSSQTYGIATLKRQTEQTVVRADALISDATYTGTITHNGNDYPWKGTLPGFTLFGGGEHGRYLTDVAAPCQDVSVYQATPELQRTLAQLVVTHFEALHAKDMQEKPTTRPGAGRLAYASPHQQGGGGG